MEFQAPGADIVGFEYRAETDQDRASIETALATLARPLELFVMPAAAECSVTQANAELESDEQPDKHEAHHGEHDKHDEQHTEHDEERTDHDEEHTEHDDEHHAEEQEHEEHQDEAGHTEFHAAYTLNLWQFGRACPKSHLPISMFLKMPGKWRCKSSGRPVLSAFEVERDSPTLDLSGSF